MCQAHQSANTSFPMRQSRYGPCPSTSAHDPSASGRSRRCSSRCAATHMSAIFRGSLYGPPQRHPQRRRAWGGFALSPADEAAKQRAASRPRGIPRLGQDRVAVAPGQDVLLQPANGANIVAGTRGPCAARVGAARVARRVAPLLARCISPCLGGIVTAPAFAPAVFQLQLQHRAQ